MEPQSRINVGVPAIRILETRPLSDYGALGAWLIDLGVGEIPQHARLANHASFVHVWDRIWSTSDFDPLGIGNL
jgi:hypothetical protein